MRRLPIALGISSALLGFLALAYDLYGPTYSGSSCSSSGIGPASCTTTSASLVQVGLSPTTVWFLASLGALFLVVFAASFLLYLHHRTGALLLFALSLFALLVATLLTGFSIGYSFLPSDLVLLLALVFALRTPPLPAPPSPLLGP